MTGMPVFFLIALLGAVHGRCLVSTEDRYPVRQLTTHPEQEGFPF